MKKYISIFSGLLLALSLNTALAQSGGVNVSGICLERNDAGVCIRYGNVSVGTNQVGLPGQQTVQQTGQQPVANSAYSAAQYNRTQSQGADLSFIANLLAQVGGIVRMLPPILMGVAVVIFFWFLIQYFISNKPEDRSKNVVGMGYSLAAIFVMVTLWGIIAFFGDAIGINPNVQVNAPQLPR